MSTRSIARNALRTPPKLTYQAKNANSNRYCVFVADKFIEESDLVTNQPTVASEILSPLPEVDIDDEIADLEA